MTSAAVTLQTKIPGDVYATLKAQGLYREHIAEESKRLLALRFFREHKLSLGQAVRLSGMDHWSFVEYLSANDVPVVDFDDEEISDEFSTVSRIAQQLQENQG